MTVITGTIAGVAAISISGSMSPGISPDVWKVAIGKDDEADPILAAAIADPSLPIPLNLHDPNGAGDDLTFEEMYIRDVKERAKLVDVEGTPTAVIDITLEDRRYLLRFDDLFEFSFNVPDESGVGYDAFSIPDLTMPEVPFTYKTAIDFIMAFMKGPKSTSSKNPEETPITSENDDQDRIVSTQEYTNKNPAQVLQELLSQVAFDLWLLPDATFVVIDSKDITFPEFEEEDVHESFETEFPIVPPDFVRLYGARKVFQISGVPLEAVAQELDGTVKPIDTLSWSPLLLETEPTSWEDAWKMKFENLLVPSDEALEELEITIPPGGFTLALLRRRARQQVFRWWRIPEILTTELFGFDEVTLEEFIISRTIGKHRYLGKIASTEPAAFGTADVRLLPAAIFSNYSIKLEKSGGGWSDPDTFPQPVSASFDVRQGIFKSHRVLLKITDPAELTFEGSIDSIDSWERADVLGDVAWSGDPRVTLSKGDPRNFYTLQLEVATDELKEITIDDIGEPFLDKRIHTIRDESFVLRMREGASLNRDELDERAEARLRAQVPTEVARKKGTTTLIGAWDYSEKLTGAVKDIQFECGSGGLHTTVKLNDARPVNPLKQPRWARQTAERATANALGQPQQDVCRSLNSSLAGAGAGLINTDHSAPMAPSGMLASDSSPPAGGADSQSGGYMEGGHRQIVNAEHFGVIPLHSFTGSDADLGEPLHSDYKAFCEIESRPKSAEGHRHKIRKVARLNLSVFKSSSGEDTDIWFIRGYKFCKVKSGSRPIYTLVEVDEAGAVRGGGAEITDVRWIYSTFWSAIEIMYNEIAAQHSYVPIGDDGLAVDDEVILFYDHKGAKICVGLTDVPEFFMASP